MYPLRHVASARRLDVFQAGELLLDPHREIEHSGDLVPVEDDPQANAGKAPVQGAPQPDDLSSHRDQHRFHTLGNVHQDDAVEAVRGDSPHAVSHRSRRRLPEESLADPRGRRQEL